MTPLRTSFASDNRYYMSYINMMQSVSTPLILVNRTGITLKDTKSMYIDNIIFSSYNLYIPNEC